MTIEGTVRPGSRLDGLAVASGAWPREAVVVAVRREDELLVPRGDLVLRPGDRIALLGPAGEGERLRHFLSDPAGPPSAAAEGEAGSDGIVATLAADAAEAAEFEDTP